MNNSMDAKETLSITPDGDDFILVRKDDKGIETSIKLSAANLINIPRITIQPIAHLLSSIESPQITQLGASAMTAVPVCGYSASQSLDGSLVFLSLQDNQGSEIGFSFEPYQAEKVAKALLEKVKGLSSLISPETKTVQ